jgi:hypothetical protein
MERDVNKLRATCKERRRKLRDREKKRALRMFAAPSFEEEKKEKSTPDSSPPSSPVQPDGAAIGGGGGGGGDRDGLDNSRFRSIGAADAMADRRSSNGNGDLDGADHLADGRKKRVSFSEHVSERLYQPDERRAQRDRRATLRLVRALGAGLWSSEWSQAAVYAGLGIAVGTMLTLACVRWVPRIKTR